MDVDRALLNKHMVAPDLVQKQGPAVDALRVREKKMQKIELRRAKTHWKLHTIVFDVDAPG
ncbi:hypothetical protein OKW35_002385 [Paraburkholderia sp. MM5477-R1]